MTTNAKNLRDTIVPKSDQLNSEQLLTGPMTITVTGVSRGNSADQPVTVHYDGENGRPFKPCKTMRKVLILAWGDDGNTWVGKSMTLFNDPEVKWGGVKVGGIRISHLSGIDRDISIALTATRGKKEPFLIKPLAGPVSEVDKYRASLTAISHNGMDALAEAWKNTPKHIQQALGAGFKDSLKESAESHDTRSKLNTMASAVPDAAQERAPTPLPPSQFDEETF